MESNSDQQTGRQGEREQAQREELIARIARIARDDGAIEPLAGLRLRRSSSPMELGYGQSDPAFCVIAQGRKELWLGDNRFRYDPDHYLIASDELPIASRITEASKERPYLGLILRLDSSLVGSVMAESGPAGSRGLATVRAIDVSPLDSGLLDAVVRLVRLLDSSNDAHFLAPLVTREIVYRLLRGDQGGRLRHIASLGGHTHRIAQAIDRLRKEFDQPMRVEDIARELGMSVSGFHHHFKEATAMSPLQFQKQLRLQQARRLLLGDDLDAATAGYRVGYNDASQFSREYKRVFGVPPMRDVERLRGTATQSAGL
jgi:AraC-like DNA-binding protein